MNNRLTVSESAVSPCRRNSPMRPPLPAVGRSERFSPFIRQLTVVEVSAITHSRKPWLKCRTWEVCPECHQSPECLVCQAYPVWAGRLQDQAAKRRRKIRRRVRLERESLYRPLCLMYLPLALHGDGRFFCFSSIHILYLYGCRPGQFGLAAAVPPCIGGLEYMYSLEKVIFIHVV